MLKIKKGDEVEIIAGKNKGKRGLVISVFPSIMKVLVKDVNFVTKHIKPKKEGAKGERLIVESPLHISNVMLVCPDTKKITRVGFIVEDGKKSRVSKISSKKID